ncbi:MAG TPA: hypothetical protein VGC96_14215 [Candidatus Elarobacter sp.]|jgi:hypothetical protein
MTDEALFHRRFLGDVRRCAAGRAPAAVAEIERRVELALTAEPEARERSWARVIAALNELLAGIPRGEVGAAARLRAFVRENADLGRPRDVAMTDFHFGLRPERVVTYTGGRSYLVFARIARAQPPAAKLDEVVPQPTRRLAEWAVYSLCGGAAAAALWFAFVVPV